MNCMSFSNKTRGAAYLPGFFFDFFLAFFPTFISSCGLGFMRARAPISFFVFSSGSVMSKPSGKCFFCPRSDMTKSHIWPEWAQKVIPSTVTQYEIKTGSFQTYTPNTNIENPSRTIKAGSVAARRPRNTCFGCNSGWMREIEEHAKPYITALMLGDRILLEPVHQYAVATFLCLIANPH
jgi:hypothetical protein